MAAKRANVQFGVLAAAAMRPNFPGKSAGINACGALVSLETICYMPRAGASRFFRDVRSWRNW
jgi:hypothetical protein